MLFHFISIAFPFLSYLLGLWFSCRIHGLPLFFVFLLVYCLICYRILWFHIILLDLWFLWPYLWSLPWFMVFKFWSIIVYLIWYYSFVLCCWINVYLARCIMCCFLHGFLFWTYCFNCTWIQFFIAWCLIYDFPARSMICYFIHVFVIIFLWSFLSDHAFMPYCLIHAFLIPDPSFVI